MIISIMHSADEALFATVGNQWDYCIPERITTDETGEFQ